MKTWTMTMPKEHPPLPLSELVAHRTWGLPLTGEALTRACEKVGGVRYYIRGDSFTFDFEGVRYQWAPTFDPLRDAPGAGVEPAIG